MAQSYSRQRLLLFNLVELEHDVLEMPQGCHYSPFLKTSDMRAVKSLRADESGAWTGRRHHLASQEEYEVFRILEGNPWVIDIREQCPMASPEVLKALLRGEKVQRNKVMTLDFVVTLAPKIFDGPLRYTALSHKPANRRESAAAERRQIREEVRANEIGWNWSYVSSPSKTAVSNHEKLRGWCTSREIDQAWGDAQNLAALFYRTSSTKSLRGQLEMFSRRLRLQDDPWFVLA